jgi:hypothetical protein
MSTRHVPGVAGQHGVSARHDRPHRRPRRGSRGLPLPGARREQAARYDRGDLGEAGRRPGGPQPPASARRPPGMRQGRSRAAHSCMRCGYDLRRLPLDADCPECGPPIRHTAEARSLAGPDCLTTAPSAPVWPPDGGPRLPVIGRVRCFPTPGSLVPGGCASISSRSFSGRSRCSLGRSRCSWSLPSVGSSRFWTFHAAWSRPSSSSPSSAP